MSDLLTIVRAGDLIVLNDAATLPASLFGRTEDGRPLEARLAGEDGGIWTAVLLGDGDWHLKTEDRPSPPVMTSGETIVFEGDLRAVVTDVSPVSPRLVTLRFDRDGAALWEALYEVGHPIQYAYTSRPLHLWDVQTSFASRPWAVESPSTGLALGPRLLQSLRERGVQLAWLTHAAGLSSTGDAALDAALPLTERYEIPERTVRMVADVHTAGGRVIAAGTTVARALEGCAAEHGALVAGAGRTSLVIGPFFRRRVVDGLLTGMHEADTSHYTMLLSFVEPSVASAAHAHAAEAGYLSHEFGDLCLALPSSAPLARTRTSARHLSQSPGHEN